MSGLWTNDRAELAKAIGWLVQNGNPDGLLIANYLIEKRTVRVLDPDDPVQRGRVAKRLRVFEVQAVAGIHRDDTDWAAGELIKALRQP
jgi:hypothetical protein